MTIFDFQTNTESLQETASNLVHVFLPLLMVQCAAYNENTAGFFGIAPSAHFPFISED